MPRDWRSVNAVRAQLRRLGDALGRRVDRVGELMRPALVRWEGLAAPVQLVVSFPLLVAAFFLLHMGLFSLSATRSLFYAIFWAIPATAAVLVATKTEAAKRRHGGPDGGQ